MSKVAPDTIAVCSMRRIEDTLARTGATRLVSIVNAHLMPPTPAGIDPALHLRLPITDARPERGSDKNTMHMMIGQLIEFARSWPHDAPLLVHCFSGLNRSPAAAYIMLAAINPTVPETLIAYRIRMMSETAAPNLPMVGTADIALVRKGHLLSAIELIGPGQPAAERQPFLLQADFR